MTLRVLLVSDAVWASSGYANQVRLLAPRLAQHCDLAMLATYGLQGAPIEWGGLTVYPGGLDPFANDVIGSTARRHQADIVITLKDTPVFRPEALAGLRWLPMTPVDHDPVPPPVVQLLRHAYRPIAYAPHGFRALCSVGFDPLYAPHAYDPAVFYSMPRTEARAALGLPGDLFLVGMVAVNRGGVPSRKAWPQNLEGFARFAKDKPSARLFLHTHIGTDGAEGAINIPALAAQLGIADKVLYCDQDKYKAGYPEEYLRLFYNSLDVLNAVSLGEGFGIPTLEAQGCGTPVIVGDWCAHEDLCFGGWTIPKHDALKFYDNQGAWVYIPQPDAIADALEHAYHDIGGAHRAAALRGAATYQIDRVIEAYWLPLLSEVEHDLRTVRSRGVLRIVTPEEVLG